MTSRIAKKQFCKNCRKEMRYSWEAKKWICDECQLSREGPSPPPPRRRKGRLTLDDKIEKWLRMRIPKNKEDLRRFLIEQLEGFFSVILFYVVVLGILVASSKLLGEWYFINGEMKGEVAINMLQAIINVDSALIGFVGVIGVFGLREISRAATRALERPQLSSEDRERLKSWQTIFLWSVLLTVLIFAASILFSLQSMSYATYCFVDKADNAVKCIVFDPILNSRFLLPLDAMFLGMAGIVWTVWSVRNPLKFVLERLRITMHLGFAAVGTATSEPLLYLEAANIWGKPITISSVPSLMLADGIQLILLGAGKPENLPYEILPGHSFQVWQEVSKIARDLREEGYSGNIDLIGQFVDSVGNSYRSKPFPFDLDAWSE